ncbi:hypothetical protein AOLI_G00101000 [Acnodon oligacanthus]
MPHKLLQRKKQRVLLVANKDGQEELPSTPCIIVIGVSWGSTLNVTQKLNLSAKSTTKSIQNPFKF